jgi:hypothetical protein
VTVKVSKKDSDLLLGKKGATGIPRHRGWQVDQMKDMSFNFDGEGMSGFVEYLAMLLKAWASKDSYPTITSLFGGTRGRGGGCQKDRSILGVLLVLPGFCNTYNVS